MSQYTGTVAWIHPSEWSGQPLFGRRAASTHSCIRLGKMPRPYGIAFEGSISKKISYVSLPNEGGATAPPSFLIWVANREIDNQEFHSASEIHDAAPHAGTVRLFYLPQGKWAVNFEVLQVSVATDLASGSDGTRLLFQWNAARRVHDKVVEADALAKLQAIGQALVEGQPLVGKPVEPDEVRAAVVRLAEPRAQSDGTRRRHVERHLGRSTADGRPVGGRSICR